MIMIIVMMLMNMVMKVSNVWSARPGHSLPAGPCESLVCGPPNSPTTHQNTNAPQGPPNSPTTHQNTNAPQVPPKPRPTHLPVILAARCTIPHTLLCHILYCAAYCTGQPPTLVTQRNRAQTAPPDCSQTRLKSDQKTTPGSSRYLPSTAPPHHSVTKMYIFKYIRIFSESNSHSYFIYFKF